MKVCKVCKYSKLNDDYSCPYCGYENAVLTVDSDDSDDYLNNLLAKLTSISFELHTGGPLSDKVETVELNSTKVKLADGTDCYKKIVWADENIWQDQEVDLDKTIPISYEFDGKEYTADVQIKTIRTDDWWKFGVTLEDNLHLRFFLGTKDNYSESELVPLKLV